jgi:hypothetical protein
MDTPWKEAVGFPGARQMGFLRKVMEENRWAELVPDRENKLVVSGCGKGGTYTPAAYSKETGTAMVYIPEIMALKIDTTVLGSKAQAQWFDPQTGAYRDAGQVTGNSTILEAPKGEDGPDRVLILKNKL